MFHWISLLSLTFEEVNCTRGEWPKLDPKTLVTPATRQNALMSVAHVARLLHRCLPVEVCAVRRDHDVGGKRDVQRGGVGLVGLLHL